jgi:hypothetical protein
MKRGPGLVERPARGFADKTGRKWSEGTLSSDLQRTSILSACHGAGSGELSCTDHRNCAAILS